MGKDGTGSRQKFHANNVALVKDASLTDLDMESQWKVSPSGKVIWTCFMLTRSELYISAISVKKQLARLKVSSHIFRSCMRGKKVISRTHFHAQSAFALEISILRRSPEGRPGKNISMNPMMEQLKKLFRNKSSKCQTQFCITPACSAGVATTGALSYKSILDSPTNSSSLTNIFNVLNVHANSITSPPGFGTLSASIRHVKAWQAALLAVLKMCVLRSLPLQELRQKTLKETNYMGPSAPES